METKTIFMAVLGIGGIIGVIYVVVSHLFWYDVRATYIMRSKKQPPPQQPHEFVSIKRGKWTRYWSNVRKFSFWGGVWYRIFHWNVEMVDQELEVLFTSKGGADFLPHSGIVYK